MKSEVEKLIASLKKELLNTPEVVRFFKLQDEIEHNNELMKWNSLMRRHQRQMTLNIDNDEKYVKHKRLYEKYKQQYETHPLAVNYQYHKEIISNLLNQLKSVIE